MSTDLTDRQLDVLRLVAAGTTNAAIGRRLFVSEDTVKTHMRYILRKLGANDRAHAVHLAYQAGLLTVDRGRGPAEDQAVAS